MIKFKTEIEHTSATFRDYKDYSPMVVGSTKKYQTTPQDSHEFIRIHECDLIELLKKVHG